MAVQQTSAITDPDTDEPGAEWRFFELRFFVLPEPHLQPVLDGVLRRKVHGAAVQMRRLGEPDYSRRKWVPDGRRTLLEGSVRADQRRNAVLPEGVLSLGELGGI